MLNKFIRRVAYFDTFGAEVKLNFHKKEYHQSPFGGFCTILLVAILSVIFVRGAISLIKKETFSVQSNKALYVDPPLTVLSPTDFMIAFSSENPITNGTKQLFDYKFSHLQQVLNDDGTLNKTELYTLSLEKCTVEHFADFDDSSKYNKILKDSLQQYYCLPLNYSLSIEGTYKSNTFQYGKITITICSDSQCYSQDELNEFKQTGMFNNSFKISTLMLNRVTNLYLESNYISYIYSDFYVQAKVGIDSKTDIYLEKQAITLDETVIPGFKNQQYDEVFQVLDNKLQTSTVFDQNSKRVGTFYIRISQQQTEYYKQYYRFDELISYVGGITKFLATLLGYFILRYNQAGLQIKLANALYQFDMPEKKKGEMVFSFQSLVGHIIDSMKSIEDIVVKFKNSAQRVIHLTRVASALRLPISQQFDKTEEEQMNQFQQRNCVIGIQNLQDQQYGNLKSEKSLEYSRESNQTLNLEQDKKKFLEQVIKLILESRKKLSYGVQFLAKQLTGTLRKDTAQSYQTKLVLKSRKMILKDMDILVVMSKLQEIEKLKHILLNKTQRKVFNYLPKPVVCIKEKIAQINTEHTQMQNDLKNRRDSMLKQKISSKSLLGGRQTFNTEGKLKRLYESYESIALSDTFDDSEKVINNRLIELVEPTLQYSFNSLVELEKLSRELRNGKKKRIISNSPKSQRMMGINSQDEIEEVNEDDLDCVTLKGSSKRIKNGLFKDTKTSVSSARQYQEVKITKVQSKQDFIDIEVFSS